MTGVVRRMQLREYIKTRQHRKVRKRLPDDLFAPEFSRLGLCPEERMTRRFEYMASHETPVILPGELITMSRTLANIPDCFTAPEWEEIRRDHFVHELGYGSNVCIDWQGVLERGLLDYRRSADGYGRRMIDALLDLCRRYSAAARAAGRDDIADVLDRVPAYPATTFREALQSFRAVHFALWLEGNYHNTCGRFDKYASKFLERDIAEGRLDRASALELTEDFFLSFNKDSDLYPGVQQGDNGQSMMLGGTDGSGRQVFGMLSELCLEAAGANMMTDPKINIRVSSETPDDVYLKGSRLTVAGLGFPQYSNDDVVIPGLIKKGYSPADAADYTVAACWEFIIPKYGEDICNIGALSFPKAVNDAIRRPGADSDFSALMKAVKQEIKAQADSICDGIRDIFFVPSPFRRLFLEPRYRNFGIHGTGIATAADSLAAINELVFGSRELTLAELTEAVDTDFEGKNALLNRLRTGMPKMGQDNDAVDLIAGELLDAFSSSLRGKVNCYGGCFRAGTGTAMFYLSHADALPASPDGRRKGEPFGTNFSPSLFARIPGPFSVISSFTKHDLTDTVNGGPLTLEFAASSFGDEESLCKLAMLVREFVRSRGHQLQLNAVSSERLRDAQLHPELYPYLIVRIWGWSAYFVELDRRYQDHVIARQEYSV